MQISMDGRNRAVDNIFTERFWRTLKYEEVYTKEYANPREAREPIRTFIHYYNHERPHQSLGYHTPAEIYLKGVRTDLYVLKPLLNIYIVERRVLKDKGKPLRSSPLAFGHSPLLLLQQRGTGSVERRGYSLATPEILS
ncbi:integrase core domain-containing protein [Kyrpidia spormannii]|uniref:integrase core domain-containing protein n=1 Tax=Kyrpidia spormannii TaxID=2055160 RepID=UPI0012FFE8EC|nr:integrase core domain-containing protein [Kyrpidia spormannii]